MAKNPETVLKERVLADLKTLPRCYARKIQQVAKRGTPDILICLGGFFVGMELKRDEHEKPDALQRYELDKITAAGGKAYVVHPLNWPGVFAELTAFAYRVAGPVQHVANVRHGA